MKTTRHLTKWGTVAAMGLAAVSLPVFGADQTSGTKSYERSTSPGFTSSADMQSTKIFGHVERANKLIGKEVLSSDNQKLGKLENVVVDLDSGRILYTVVGSGGVLGAGEKKFAAPPRAFNNIQGDNLTLKVDKAKFEGAPQFTSDINKDSEMGKTAFVKQVDQYFSQGAIDRASSQISNSTEFRSVHKVDDIIGMKVKNSSEADLGKVDNVALDLPRGRVIYVILSPDSSLKLGNDYFALPPNELMFSTDGKYLTTDVTKEKLAGAPHFAKGDWANLSNRRWAAQVYQYYGKQPYFESGSRLEPTGRTGDKTLPKTKN